jgi:hypothetical protein
MPTQKNPYQYKKSPRHERKIELSELEKAKRIPIEGYDNYFVTDTGDVFEIRKVPQHLTYNGYPSVALNRIEFRVHCLVLLAFVGERPEGQVVRHLNDVKTDNRLHNLSYGTQSENAYDAVRNGKRIAGQTKYKGEDHYKSKLTEAIVKEIREIKKQNPRMGGIRIGKHLQEKYGITMTKENIQAIYNRKTWKHVE